MRKPTNYIVIRDNAKNNHAGTKGRNDVEAIALEEGYKPIYIREFMGRSGIRYRLKQLWFVGRDWLPVFFRLQRGSQLVLQVPMYFSQKYVLVILKLYQRLHHISVTLVMQDFDALRGMRDIKKEIKPLRLADKIICHSDRMKQAMVGLDLAADKMIPIGLFDYLISGQGAVPTRTRTNEIIIAGNLEPEKAGYLYKLGTLNDSLNSPVIFHLYGPNFVSAEPQSGVRFKGEFSPDEVFYRMVGSYGLVWDGESLDSCTGLMGEYLRINNPNKTSLYLAAGLPVIVWSQSSNAEIVKREQVGITVDSLAQLPEILAAIGDQEYKILLNNVSRISEKLRSGYFTKEALCKSRIDTRG
jgi:hypothetical protein